MSPRTWVGDHAFEGPGVVSTPAYLIAVSEENAMKVRRTFTTFALVLGVGFGLSSSAGATTVDTGVYSSFRYMPLVAPAAQPVVQSEANENTANQSNTEQQSLVSAFSQTASAMNFMSWSNMVTADLFTRLTATAIVVREPDMVGQGTYTLPAANTSFATPAPFAQQTQYTIPSFFNAPSVPSLVAPSLTMASSVIAPTYQTWGTYGGMGGLYSNFYAPLMNFGYTPPPATASVNNPYSLGNQLGNLPLGGPVSMPGGLHAPEPMSVVLIGTGLAALILVRRRKQSVL